MRSNSYIDAKASYASREKEMAAYDALPASVRRALANAVFDWAAYPIRRWFEKGLFRAKDLAAEIGFREKDLAAEIGKWDRDQIAKDRARVWGFPAERKTTRRRRRA